MANSSKEQPRSAENIGLLPAVEIRPHPLVAGGNELSDWNAENWRDGLLVADHSLDVDDEYKLTRVRAEDTRDNLGTIMYEVYDGMKKFYHFFPGSNIGSSRREFQRIPKIWLTTNEYVAAQKGKGNYFLDYQPSEGKLYVVTEMLALKAGNSHWNEYSNITNQLTKGRDGQNRRVITQMNVSPTGGLLLDGARTAAYHLYTQKYGVQPHIDLKHSESLEAHDRQAYVVYGILGELAVAQALVDEFAVNHPNEAAQGGYLAISDATIQYLRLRIKRACGEKIEGRGMLKDLEQIRQTLDLQYRESCKRRGKDVDGLEKDLAKNIEFAA